MKRQNLYGVYVLGEGSDRAATRLVVEIGQHGVSRGVRGGAAASTPSGLEQVDRSPPWERQRSFSSDDVLRGPRYRRWSSLKVERMDLVDWMLIHDRWLHSRLGKPDGPTPELMAAWSRADWLEVSRLCEK